MTSLNDVLLAMSNIPVDDPIAEIWGRGLQGGYKIIKYTGSLPITINADGNALLDYRIYGGVGVATENLYNWRTDTKYSYIIAQGSIWQSGTSDNKVSDKIPVVGGKTYLLVNPITVYGTGLYAVFYKANNVALSSVLLSLNTTVYTLEAPPEAAYFRSSLKRNGDENDVTMFIEGSTAPPNYIPYGYKLPMTVYTQEFVVTNDMLDQSNWVLSPPDLLNDSYFIYFDITDFISKEECVAKIYENFSAGYTPGLLVVALTDGVYTLVGQEYRILKNDGVISNKEFDFSSWDKIYLCIGYGDGFHTDNTKQQKINEFFGNWEILIAPTSQTQESPVYIGDAPLDEGEYVSFSEQKIYRDVSGTLTPTDPPVPLPKIPTIKGETVIDYDGEPKPSQMYIKYKDKE